MKNFLLASSLLLSLSLANTGHSYERPEDGPMTKAQADNLRVNAVTLVVTDVNDRIFSKKAKAKYEALLSNPFTRGIICDIELTSTQEAEVIETITHPAIYVPARSAQLVKGEIKIKRGKKENNGLEWIFAKGESVAAKNCRFVD